MKRRNDLLSDIRSRELAALPWWYSPYAHLSATTGVGVFALVIALSQIKNLRWEELIIIPITIIIANFFEWYAHKNILHRRRRFWETLFEKHVLLHHRIYRWKSMAIRDFRESAFVLIPSIGVLGIVLAASPMAALTGIVFGANVGWLMLMTQALYVVCYELTHLSYHLPKGHPVRSIPIIRVLGTHHARHHAPELMQRYNFNVTLPLADVVLGTVAPREVIETLKRKKKQNRSH
ncbi:MAG: sterol desaturase family protein [bacterium]|nr:sterol desaturase family protein [bacterium]